MSAGRLIATDLDRTLLPNGVPPESPGARGVLKTLIEARALLLAFVTGRRLELVVEAISEYDLPRPGFVLADVGSSLYHADGDAWRSSEQWAAWLAEDWGGREGAEVAPLLAEEPDLELQEPLAQRPFKLSFYCDSRADAHSLRDRLLRRLRGEGLRSVVVCSVDEISGRGLVDVLPERSNKRGALEFLLRRLDLSAEDALFAGDSGNDLDVLTSPIPAVLVANADPSVRRLAVSEAGRLGLRDRLHVARGGELGMNGNYAAGILEGWLHFHPEDRALLERASRNLRGDVV